MQTSVVRCASVLAIAIGLMCALFVFLPSAAGLPPVGAAPVDYSWTDEFDSATLDPRWSWSDENPAYWSLTDRPGYMRITSTNSISPQNRLFQYIPAGSFEVETKVIFTKTQSAEVAGMGVYQDKDNFFVLGRAYCDFATVPGCMGDGVYFGHVEQGEIIGYNVVLMAATEQGVSYLRIRRVGSTFYGYVSENGTSWTQVGAHSIVSGMVPVKAGISYAGHDNEGGEHIADFDYFRLDEWARVFLPFVVRG